MTDDSDDDFLTISSKLTRKKKNAGKVGANGGTQAAKASKNGHVSQETAVPTAPVTSVTDEVFIPECPFCGKRTKGFEDKMCHVKSCGRKRGITAEKQLAALRLQQKQVQERKNLGLPSQNVLPKRSPIKLNKNPRVRIEGTETDLQTALALSASLQEAIETAHFPIPPTEPEPAPKKPTSKTNPYGNVATRRRGQKNVQKVFPLLQSSLEERRLAVVEHVSDIMCETRENSIPELLFDFYRYKEEANRIPQLSVETTSPRLWKLNSCETPAKETGLSTSYRVEELKEFFSPTSRRTGRPKLRSLKELPGRDDTQMVQDKFTAGPSTSSTHDCVQSTQDVLMNLCDSSPEEILQVRCDEPPIARPASPPPQPIPTPPTWNHSPQSPLVIDVQDEEEDLVPPSPPPRLNTSKETKPPSQDFSSLPDRIRSLIREGRRTLDKPKLAPFFQNWRNFAEDSSNHDCFFFSRDGDTHGISSAVLKAQCPDLLVHFRSKNVTSYSDVLGDRSKEAVEGFFELLHVGSILEQFSEEVLKEIREICEKYDCKLFESNSLEKVVEKQPTEEVQALEEEASIEITHEHVVGRLSPEHSFSAPVRRVSNTPEPGRRSVRETRSITPDLFDDPGPGMDTSLAEPLVEPSPERGHLQRGVSNDSSVVLVEDEEQERTFVEEVVPVEDVDHQRMVEAFLAGGEEEGQEECNYVDDGNMFTLSPPDLSQERIDDTTPTRTSQQHSSPPLMSPPRDLEHDFFSPPRQQPTLVAATPVVDVVVATRPVSVGRSANANMTPAVRNRARVLPEATPDFNAMMTPDLQRRLTAMGVRKMPRSKSVKLLMYIHRQLKQQESQHLGQSSTAMSQAVPTARSAPARRSLTQPAEPLENERLSPIQDEEENDGESHEWCDEPAGEAEPEDDYELSQQTQSGRGRKRIRKLTAEEAYPAVKRFILERPALYTRILHYEPLPLIDLKKDLDACKIVVDPPILQDVLDKLGVIFRIPRTSRPNTNRRGRGRPRGGANAAASSQPAVEA